MRRRIRDDVGASIYYDISSGEPFTGEREGVYPLVGEGLFDVFKKVATKTTSKMTGKVAKDIATKAATKAFEKGAEKVGEKTGQLIGEKIYDRFRVREEPSSPQAPLLVEPTHQVAEARSVSRENKGDLIIKELQKANRSKKPPDSQGKPLTGKTPRNTISDQFDALLKL